MLLSVCTGEIKISPQTLWKVLISGDSMEHDILIRLRIPRTLMGFAVGGSLSLCGVILQGIYRNPLVEPYTLGISGGASLGVTIALVFNCINIFALPIFGFAGAFATIFIVYFLSIKRGRIETNKMLLVGIMISFISSSIVMFLLSITSAEKVHGVLFWTMGSLAQTDISITIWMSIVALIGIAVSYLFATDLNILRLGQVKANHLGVNTQIVIKILFVITSILTGSCIATAGVIGFVGLIVPHTARIISGNNYKVLLGTSFLIGSIFLILCDIIAKSIIYPNELPIGVITGIIGGIAFLSIMRSSKKKSERA